MAKSLEHATAARTVPSSSLAHSFPFGQNLGNCISCERIEKKLDCYNTCTSKILKIQYLEGCHPLSTYFDLIKSFFHYLAKESSSAINSALCSLCRLFNCSAPGTSVANSSLFKRMVFSLIHCIKSVCSPRKRNMS